MARRTHIQRDFSGGAISPKMLMRQDTDVYKRSVLSMQNYIPTPQGSALRAPGTRFVEALTDDNVRIIPYLSPANERSMVVLTPEACDIKFNVNDSTREDYSNVEEVAGTLVFRRRINQNHAFRDGLTNWQGEPAQYQGADGFPGLGTYADPDRNNVIMRPRIYNDPGDGIAVCTLDSSCVVDVATTVGTIRFQARYGNNWAWESEFGGWEFKVQVSEDDTFATTLYQQVYNDSNYTVGAVFFEEDNFNLPTADWTGTLYMRITATARANNDSPYSNPRFIVNFLEIFANGETDITTLTQTLTTPYLAADLPDVHYIQSPYDPKELVFTHARHPPQRLRFTTGSGIYVFEAIPFTNQPTAWGENNYPATCGSCNGRLVLAGAADFKTAPGDPVATVSETVWMTDVGDWTTFTDGINPDDSIEFTAIYRSPIQWVYGQRSLLVGAREYEYAASASSDTGVLAPGDLGVFLQSTHGSTNVQPAGFGEGVLFAADGGTKVRQLSYRDETNGWVADDLTLYNPEICISGIIRMVRQRNPHQMCLALLNDGTLAIYHSESGVAGWTRYVLNNAQIKDICVVPNDEGIDVPFFVVNRVIDGESVTYLECIPDWSYKYDWDYTESSLKFQFDSATAIIDGLDHLEGKRVQVYNEDSFIGNFTVDNGRVILSDDTDEGVTPLISARVGLQHRCVLTILPPEKVDPGAHFRYSSFAVRVVNSTRPIINGERPANRRPGMPLATSQIFEQFEDVDIVVRGWDPYQVIEISEQAPFRNEIIGVYGTLKEGTIT